ncbi:MAG: hypothetical protein ACOZCO_04040 [Bacteroidota bacterium]
MKKIFLFTIMCLSLSRVDAQDKIVLLTGKVLTGKVLSYDEAYLQYSYMKKKEVKTDMLDRYRIYSTIDSSGKENVLYVRDTTVGNFLTEPEMRLFIAGEQDAQKNFKCRGYNTTGFLFALGISLLDTYEKQDGQPFFNGFFREDPGILHFATPFVYPIIASLPPISLRIRDVTERKNLLEEPYIEGFERVGKQKRRFGGLLYSTIGSATGIGLYLLGKWIQ